MLNTRTLSPLGWGAAALGILAAIILLSAGWNRLWSWLPWSAESRVERAETTATQATGQAAVAVGRAGAAQDAAAIVSRSIERFETTRIIHEENRDAILSAPGADQRLDPDLNDRGRRGLCRYAAYAADPVCAELRRPDPGQLQDPGGRDAAAAP